MKTIMVGAYVLLCITADAQINKHQLTEVKDTSKIREIVKKPVFRDTCLTVRLWLTKYEAFKSNNTNLSKLASELINNYLEPERKISETKTKKEVKSIVPDPNDKNYLIVTYTDGTIEKVHAKYDPAKTDDVIVSFPVITGDQNLLTYTAALKGALKTSLENITSPEAFKKFEETETDLNVYELIYRRTQLLIFLTKK